jgi:hypothetical protein
MAVLKVKVVFKHLLIAVECMERKSTVKFNIAFRIKVENKVSHDIGRPCLVCIHIKNRKKRIVNKKVSNPWGTNP